MSRIESLTPEQEAMLPQIADKWIEIGRYTGPTDEVAGEAAVKLAYECAGLTPPTDFRWADSPLAGAKIAAELQETSVRQALRNACFGNHDAGWLSFYDAMKQIGVEEIEPLLKGLFAVAKFVGWWWAFDDVAVLTRMPIHMTLDGQGRLHNETEQAIRYADGWGLYSWNGTRVPEDLVTVGWTTDQILNEQNAEIRRCAIEKIGWPAFLQDMGKVVDVAPDPANPGFELTLYELKQQVFDEPVRVLHCVNATAERDGTRHEFGLTVPASISKAVAAAGWTFGLNPDVYAAMVRAS